MVLRVGRFTGLRGPDQFPIFPGLEHALFVDRWLLTLDISGQADYVVNAGARIQPQMVDLVPLACWHVRIRQEEPSYPGDWLMNVDGERS